MMLGLSTTKMQAAPVIYGNGQEITKIKELPNTEDYTLTAQDGRTYHGDLGILHDEFSLFWIPIWNYGDYKYVLYTDTKVGSNDYTYVDLDDSDIAYLQSRFSGIETEPTLPFWNAIGGKLALIAILAVIGMVKNGSN